MARKYGRKAGKMVKSTMHRMKVRSRKQAIAIGLSEARKKGAKVPRKRGGRRKTS